MGGSLVVWQPPRHDAGPVRSLADALDRGLRVRGAMTVLIGDLTREEAIVWAQAPGVATGLALRSAHSCLVLERLLRARGEVAKEVVVCGTRYVSLLQSVAHPTSGHLFLHLSLARTASNLALASMELNPIMRDLPALVSHHNAPGIVRLPVSASPISAV
jgi:hypothetical protein